MKNLILIVSITFSSFVYSSDDDLKDCRYRNYATYLSSGPYGDGSSRYYVMTGNHPTPSTVLSRWDSVTTHFEEPSYSKSLLQLADFMRDLEDNNYCKIRPSRCSLNGETDRFDPTVVSPLGTFNHFNVSIYYYSDIEKRIGVRAITTGSGTPYVRYRHYNYGSGQTSISFGGAAYLDLDKMKNVLSEVKMGLEILHEKNICSNKIDRTECSFIERKLSRGWRDFWVKSDDIDVNIKTLASDNKTTIEDIKEIFIDAELCL